MGYLLEDRTVYLDRYTVAGDWTLDLADFLMSAEAKAAYPPSAALTITSGNSAGHFQVSSGILGISSAGDTADLSAGTYTFTVSASFTGFPAPFNVDTCTLKVLCPAVSIYVDPALGSPSNPGTKAAPFSRSPDDVLASGNELAYAAVVPTLVVHKNGSFIRSRLAFRNVNNINAGKVGWGSQSQPVTYCGSDTVTAVSATSGEVFANPNLANIKAQTVPGGPLHISQYLIDRTNNSLMHWAQWPAVIGDPFLEAHDPQHHLTGGMFRMPATAVPVHEATYVDGNGVTKTVKDVFDGILTLPAAAVTEFGTKSLVGAYVGLWTYASFINWYPITAHNTTTNVITFDSGEARGLYRQRQIVKEGGVDTTAFQIVGHPHSIKAAGQFAWSADQTKVFSWPVSGQAPEIMVRQSAYFCGSTNNSGAIYGLTAEGYYGKIDGEGSGWQKYANSPTYTYNVLNCVFRWLCNRVGNGGALRANNSGVATAMLVEGNYVYDCMGAAGMRISTKGGNADCVVQSNRFKRLNVTCVYWPGAVRLIYQRNHMEDILGPHANGFTIYGSPPDVPRPPDNIVRYNTFKRVCRPMTLDICDRLQVYRNFIEIDGIVKDAVRFYGVDTGAHVYENIFCQPAGMTPTGEDALAAGTVGAGLWERNVIAGLTGGQGTPAGTSNGVPYDAVAGSADWIDNLLSYRPSNSTDLAVNGDRSSILNTGTWSGNRYERGDYFGTILPRWKQVVGAGPIGRGMMITGIAVVSFDNKNHVLTNSTVEADEWKLLEADSTRPISVTNGEYSIADNASGLNQTAWTSTSGTVAPNKYLKLRTLSPNAYQTEKSVTVDLGDSNIYTWTIKTKQAAGYPLIAIDKVNDWWQMNPASGLGPTTTKTLTMAFFGRVDGIPNNASMIAGHYAGGASTRVMIEAIASGTWRITARAAASPDTSFSFQTPVLFPTGVGASELSMILLTVDASKATAAEGINIYINGVKNTTLTGATTWKTNGTGDIDWASSFLFKVMAQSFDGLVGMFLLDPRWVDLDDANVRDKFNAHRIGTNGENIFGTAPSIFLTGDTAAWMNLTPGINRGTYGKFKAQGSTAITLDSGGATAWPWYVYTTALTGLAGSNGTVGQPSEYSLSTNGALANPLVVTLSDGGRGGTFSPTSLTFGAATEPQTAVFNYTPAVSGNTTLTASASGVTSTALVISPPDFYTTLPKGTVVTLTRAQFNALLQRSEALSIGLLSGVISFEYKTGEGETGVTKTVDLSYLVDTGIIDQDVLMSSTEVKPMAEMISAVGVPSGNSSTLSNPAGSPIQVRFIA